MSGNLRPALLAAGRLLRLYLTPVALFTSALFISRVALYALNVPRLGLSPAEAVEPLLRGLRFDIATAFIISAPFLLFLFIPGRAAGRIAEWLALRALLAVHLGLSGYLLFDINFFADTRRHLAHEPIMALGTAGAVVWTGLYAFAGQVAVLFMMMGAYGWLYLRLIRTAGARPELSSRPRFTRAAAWSAALLAAIALTVIGARGGLQYKPLNVRDAFASAREASGNLSLNGVYTTLQAAYEYSRGGRIRTAALTPEQTAAVVERIVAKDIEQTDPAYPLFRRYRFSPNETRRKNVVLFIMESWTARYIASLGGKTAATPFFDTLAGESLLMNNCLANAQRTFEGVTASAGSFPTWNYLIIGRSGLAYQTRQRPVGDVFARLGYDTLFIHGGPRNTLGLEGIVQRLGFQRHVSMEDFTKEEYHHDGAWGMYDENTFRKAHSIFAAQKRPFFSVVLSLTSHLPFNLPSPEFDLHTDQQGDLRQFLNSLSYADYSLEKFFELARASDYYKDTLFVIVADHVAGFYVDENMRDNYRIPLLFHDGGGGLNGVEQKVVSQFDIIPSILHHLRVSEPFTAWGKSVFAQGPRAAILPRGPMRLYIEEPYMLEADDDHLFRLLDLFESPINDLQGAKPEQAARMRKAMDDYVAFSENLIVQNRLAPPEK
ncbi:MAG: sulfatase-like hydrolase/transferase [Nitrospinae bacterium]|nr:sulfatase-like hydrolase/transferase [Nitrospinota bacterium]